MAELKKNKKSEDHNDFGNFLAQARQKKGLTLVEVAKALKLNSGQPIWDWENGKGSGIPADALLRLVKIYGISADRAYEELMKFHQERTERKVREKFELAKVLVLGKK